MEVLKAMPLFNPGDRLPNYELSVPDENGSSALSTRALGKCAVDLSEMLLEPLVPGGKFLGNDAAQSGLYRLAILEDRLQTVNLHQDLPIPAIRRIHDHVSTFHAALPLSDQERARILALWRTGLTDAIPLDNFTYDVAELSSVSVLSAGLRSVSNGQQIADRWEQWAERSGLYTDHETLQQARSALAGIAVAVLPSRDPLLERLDSMLNDYDPSFESPEAYVPGWSVCADLALIH